MQTIFCGRSITSRLYFLREARDARSRQLVDLGLRVAELGEDLRRVLAEHWRRRGVRNSLAVDLQRHRHRLVPFELLEHAARTSLLVRGHLGEVLDGSDRDALELREPVG